MIFKNIGLIDKNFNFVKNTNVLIKDKKFSKIGNFNTDDYDCDVLDGKNLVMLPGFVNNHTHIPMTLLRGYAEDLPLNRWLTEKVFPFEDKIKPEDAYNASVIAIAEMLSFGVTSFTDMYFFCEDICRAVKEIGIKANISRGLVSFDNIDLYSIKAFKESENLYKKYNNKDNILIDMCIHGEYTSNKIIVKDMAAFTKDLGCNIHIHLSETQEETSDCIDRHNMTPTQYMDYYGVFKNKTTAAHCVYISDEDIEILKENDVTVAHCPVSNLKLGNSISPVSKFLKNNINVSIGTDGVASNNNFNMIEEIKLACILQKSKEQDPSVLGTKKALEMLTINGYKSQGREKTGYIVEGNYADCVVFDLDSINMLPNYDILTNIIYSSTAKNIKMTIINGDILYKNGEYCNIDLERAKFNMRSSVANICKLI